MHFALVYPGEKTRFKLTAVLAILFWIAIILGTLGIALIYLLFFYVFFLFAQSAFISYLRGNAVKITPAQFPDLHQRIATTSAKVGVITVPDAYLLHADGLFNALATRFLGRNYIVLFTSVVDALDSRPEALDFYIGHELGHIHRKHLTWGPVLAPMAWLPLLGASLRRAEEYTCDRYGLAACASADDAKAGMAALAAGHSRWQRLSYQDYAEQRRELTGFWASFHEFCSDYPWTAKRAYAIDELSQDREPKQLGRNGFAGFLALFVPRVPGAGGAGFLVAVAIIGILAAIAIPAYQDYIKRAAAVGVLSHAGAGKQAVETYAFDKNEWPGSIEDLALEQTTFSSGKTTVNIELGESGVLRYVLSSGGALVLTPSATVEDDKLKAIEWHCGGEDIADKLLPATCRD